MFRGECLRWASKLQFPGPAGVRSTVKSKRDKPQTPESPRATDKMEVACKMTKKEERETPGSEFVIQISSEAGPSTSRAPCRMYIRCKATPHSHSGMVEFVSKGKRAGLAFVTFPNRRRRARRAECCGADRLVTGNRSPTLSFLATEYGGGESEGNEPWVYRPRTR